MSHQEDIDTDLRKVLKEGVYWLRVADSEELESVLTSMILKAYAAGYDRHSQTYGWDNVKLCRTTDNLNICEGGPLGPDHRHQFPLVF